ncbi:MAG: RHS repeat-associated core domain-containing protein [Nitrososphaerota archaeon]|nr:RHS repeat-associated core domain-containing protein [Nitrososphaerota archaeon]
MVNFSIRYLHEDALGSTRLVMPASIVSSFSSNYVPYGMDYAMVGEELFQYTGKLLDESTGLYYEGARYYDPTTGRFITEDSYNGTLTDPLSQNRYLYAEDNPMRYVDPTGHVMAVSTGDGGGTPYCGSDPANPQCTTTTTTTQTASSPSQTSHHTEKDIITLLTFLIYTNTPGLEIPVWLMPILAGSLGTVGALQTAIAYALLPLVIEYDVSNNAMNERVPDSLAAGTLAAATVQFVFGFFDFGASTAAGFLLAGSVGTYVELRLQEDPALDDAIYSQLESLLAES